MRSNHRRIPAAYISYGNIQIATPDVFVKNPTPPARKSTNDSPDGNIQSGTNVSTNRTLLRSHHIRPRAESSLGTTATFKPTRLALAQQGILEGPVDRNPGFGYKGDMSSQGYQLQAADLLDSENCALWLKNMTLQTSEGEIFDKITTGAVSILHFYEPTEEHGSKAAKLVFMNPRGATRFLRECRGNLGVWIRGRRLYCWYNRDGYRQHPQPSQSRVIHVNGPKDIMTFEHWDSYFRQWCVLQWDGHDIIFEDEDRRIMEFRFSRIDGQAQTCLQAIDADESIDKTVTWAYYGHDPCDVENAIE
jgi:hypothetical protein